MLTWTIQNYLERNNVPFEIIEHPRTSTAEETAHAAHVPENEFAKTVIVWVDGQMTMVVTHADERINLEKLRRVLNVEEVELCSERDFKARFPDCELGAMPPFGDLFRMPVLISESVPEKDYLALNAGTHTDIIKIPYEAFERLVHPQHVDCVYH